MIGSALSSASIFFYHETEVFGSYSATFLLRPIGTFHHIASGSATICCDNIHYLHCSVSPTCSITSHSCDFDLLLETK